MSNSTADTLLGLLAIDLYIMVEQDYVNTDSQMRRDL